MSAADPHPIPTAAFFDLDKTVIAKSSASAFNKSFLEQGLLTPRRAVLKSSDAQFPTLMPPSSSPTTGCADATWSWSRHPGRRSSRRSRA